MGKALSIGILLIMLTFVVLGTFMIGRSSQPDDSLLALSDVPPPSELAPPSWAGPAEPVAESDLEAAIKTPEVQPYESFEYNDEPTAPTFPEPPAEPEREPAPELAVVAGPGTDSSPGTEPDAEATMVASPPVSTSDGAVAVDGRMVEPVAVKWFHIPGTRIRIGATPRD